MSLRIKRHRRLQQIEIGKRAREKRRNKEGGREIEERERESVERTGEKEGEQERKKQERKKKGTERKAGEERREKRGSVARCSRDERWWYQ